MPAKCLPIPLGKYMWAIHYGPERPRLTDSWRIQGHKGDLGLVQWHGPGRHYCFFPEVNTAFNSECLALLSNFVAEQTDIYRGNGPT